MFEFVKLFILIDVSTFNLSIVDMVVKFTICIRKRFMDTIAATFVVRSEIDREKNLWATSGGDQRMEIFNLILNFYRKKL